MTLPMGEGPPDGDFARYVEQLSAGSAAAIGAQAGVGGAPKPAASAPGGVPERSPLRGVLARKSKERAVAQAAPLQVKLAALLWVVGLVGFLAWSFAPGLLPAVLVLGVAWFVASVIRAAGRAARRPR